MGSFLESAPVILPETSATLHITVEQAKQDLWLKLVSRFVIWAQSHKHKSQQNEHKQFAILQDGARLSNANCGWHYCKGNDILSRRYKISMLSREFFIPHHYVNSRTPEDRRKPVWLVPSSCIVRTPTVARTNRAVLFDHSHLQVRLLIFYQFTDPRG